MMYMYVNYQLGHHNNQTLEFEIEFFFANTVKIYYTHVLQSTDD